MVLSLFLKDTIYEPTQQIGQYTVIRCVGEGKYGICYLVHKGEKEFIFKQLKTKLLRKIGSKVVFEWNLLSHANHECIPKLIEKIEYENISGYILEFKSGKTFEEIVYVDNYVFDRKEIWEIGRQLIDILKYLHHNGIVHRDIRLPNVIYNEGRISLVDFGLARWTGGKYNYDIDFAYLGDFLIHLFYTSYKVGSTKKRPWYEELDLDSNELIFLKRLMGIEERYQDISDVEHDFHMIY